MHPEADAFLDAIFDHPDDDTHRLVYADWLEEYGQGNYAQFIRLQCAAAREKLWSDEANRLWEEIGRVWTRLHDEWYPLIAEAWAEIPCALDAMHFERGLLRPNVPATADQMLRYANAIPWLFGSITSLLLASEDGEFESIAESVFLRRITRVRCPSDWWLWNDERYSDEIDAVLCSPHLCSVKVLYLSPLQLTESNLNALLSAPNLSSVQELTVALGHHSSFDHSKALRQLRSRFASVVRHE